MKTKKDKKKNKSENTKPCPLDIKCKLYTYKDGFETITQCKTCKKVINITY